MILNEEPLRKLWRIIAGGARRTLFANSYYRLHFYVELISLRISCGVCTLLPIFTKQILYFTILMVFVHFLLSITNIF